jgi:hypothetical protein
VLEYPSIALLHQPPHKTERPDFGAAPLYLESLEHNPDSHGSESPRGRERRKLASTGLGGFARLKRKGPDISGGIMDERLDRA